MVRLVRNRGSGNCLCCFRRRGSDPNLFRARRHAHNCAGYLRGMRDEVNYVLRAKAGQHMRVEIRGRGPTRGMVTFPSGEGEGGPGGVVFDGNIPDTGDYRIRVTESSMANAWRGSFTLIGDVVGGNFSEIKGRDRQARV